MRCSFYFSFFLLLFLMTFSSVISEYRGSTCNNHSTFTIGGTYSTNLDLVITDLLANTPQSSGFNTSSRGQLPNKVYGLLQCIGNTSATKCSECSREANNSLRQLCGNDTGGQIWMDFCFLRYNNSNFISTLNTDMDLLENVKVVTSDVQGFKTTTSNLLTNLSDKAFIPANKLFAAGSVNLSISETIYGLVQCWRDLSIKDCRSCVSTARQALEQCCSSSQGGQALLGSCTVRYEIYPFLDYARPPSHSPKPSGISVYRGSSCNRNSTYTIGGTYSNNLDRVIADLLANTPQGSGFNTSSRGQSPNKVYGLLQCIGNTSTAKCSECSREANKNLRQICGNSIGGKIWMDNCFLHYDNSNFISTLNTDMQIFKDVKIVTSNYQGFKTTTSNLLTNLSDKAYNPASKLFAAGSANYSTSHTVYGLVQCWRDLSIKDCRSCLFTARQALAECCSPSQGAVAMLGSCMVRYETYPYFDSAESPSPSPQPSSPNSAKGTSRRKSDNKSSKILPIILGIVGAMILAFVICLIGMRRKVKAAVFGRPVTVDTPKEDKHGYSPDKSFSKIVGNI